MEYCHYSIHTTIYTYIGVSKNRGSPPKWMVYNGKLYEQLDDLGGNTPIFASTPICIYIHIHIHIYIYICYIYIYIYIYTFLAC